MTSSPPRRNASNAPARFEQAVDHLNGVLDRRHWPRPVAWLGSPDLRLRVNHVILRACARADARRFDEAEERYAAAIDAGMNVSIHVPGRTLGLVFSFLAVEPSTANTSQLQVRFWSFDMSRAHAVTHGCVHWRLRDAGLDVEFLRALANLGSGAGVPDNVGHL
jgi:hypothetical protein